MRWRLSVTKDFKLHCACVLLKEKSSWYLNETGPVWCNEGAWWLTALASGQLAMEHQPTLNCKQCLAQLFFQLVTLQSSGVSHWFSFKSDKSSRFWLTWLWASTKTEMKLRRLEGKCLCQAPANQNMAIFNNCLCEIVAENTTSVKNMTNLLQPINICMIHSCLLDVYKSQIPYRTVKCWLLYFWFISFYPAGQNQSFERRAISTNNNRKRKLLAWPTFLWDLASIFFNTHHRLV